MLTIEDREELCNGICSVVASLADDEREKSYHAFAMPVVECLHTLTKQADAAKDQGVGRLTPIIPKLADELRLLSTMVKSFSSALAKASIGNTSKHDSPSSFTMQASVELLKKLWPCLSHIAASFSSDKVR